MRSLLSLMLLLTIAGCRSESSASGSPETQDEVTNPVDMQFARIPRGTFSMGSSLSAEGVADRFGGQARFCVDEHPAHEVTLSKPYEIGVTEVTRSQWQAVMKTQPWRGKSAAGNDPQCPATFVTYSDALEFCERLTAINGDGFAYRLPTEAEWEFAARGGTTTVFHFGDDPLQLKQYGWSSDTADAPQPVAQLKPNGFGLFDTCGNVFEWCSDHHSAAYYAESPKVDPTGPATGEARVLRGGSWFNTARFCRSAFRDDAVPQKKASDVGFRVVRTAE